MRDIRVDWDLENGTIRHDTSNDVFIRVVVGEYSVGLNVGNQYGKDAPISTLKSDTIFFLGEIGRYSDMNQ